MQRELQKQEGLLDPKKTALQQEKDLKESGGESVLNQMAIFEEKANQAQATAAASQPPVLSQREKAMRAFGSKLER